MADFSTALRTVTARKPHMCEAFRAFNASGYVLDPVAAEHRHTVERMRAAKGVISKGAACLFWGGRFEGRMFNAYADKDMHALVYELDLYDN